MLKRAGADRVSQRRRLLLSIPRHQQDFGAYAARGHVENQHANTSMSVPGQKIVFISHQDRACTNGNTLIRVCSRCYLFFFHNSDYLNQMTFLFFLAKIAESRDSLVKKIYFGFDWFERRVSVFSCNKKGSNKYFAVPCYFFPQLNFRGNS